MQKRFSIIVKEFFASFFALFSEPLCEPIFVSRHSFIELLGIALAIAAGNACQIFYWRKKLALAYGIHQASPNIAPIISGAFLPWRHDQWIKLAGVGVVLE